MNTFHFCFEVPSGRPGRSGNGRAWGKSERLHCKQTRFSAVTSHRSLSRYAGPWTFQWQHVVRSIYCIPLALHTFATKRCPRAELADCENNSAAMGGRRQAPWFLDGTAYNALHSCRNNCCAPGRRPGVRGALLTNKVRAVSRQSRDRELFSHAPQLEAEALCWLIYCHGAWAMRYDLVAVLSMTGGGAPCRQ